MSLSPKAQAEHIGNSPFSDRQLGNRSHWDDDGYHDYGVFYMITAYTPTFGNAVLHLANVDSLIVTLCVGASNLFWLPSWARYPTESDAGRYSSPARC